MVCVVCKNTYQARITPSELRLGKGKVCSKVCKGIHNGWSKLKPRVDKVCRNCGKAFLVKQSEVKRGGGKFCSVACLGTEKKERKMSTDGYWEIHVPEATPNSIKGVMKEHRYVMQCFIGRPLLPSEIIHHKNEDKLDNRLDNLEIVSRSEHNKLHNFLHGGRIEKKSQSLRKTGSTPCRSKKSS